MPNKAYKFRTKNWVEINDDAYGMYNTNSQISFKTAILKPSLCHYSDAYILAKVIITIAYTLAAAAAADNANKD